MFVPFQSASICLLLVQFHFTSSLQPCIFFGFVNFIRVGSNQNATTVRRPGYTETVKPLQPRYSSTTRRVARTPKRKMRLEFFIRRRSLNLLTRKKKWSEFSVFGGNSLDWTPWESTYDVFDSMQSMLCAVNVMSLDFLRILGENRNSSLNRIRFQLHCDCVPHGTSARR